MKLNTEKKVLITGRSGNLGTEIRKIIKCIAPTLRELDITKPKMCEKVIDKYNPDIIIHTAAFTDVAGAEKNKKQCWSINVEGTQNMARAALGRRFVYISTDYVFDGTKWRYKETDIPNPINFYSLTKLIGEVIIKQYPNTLIIRTAFKPNGPWKYRGAFIDQWGSHDFVRNIAPDIVRASLMEDLAGIIHIAGKRKRIYDLARKASPKVGKISINDITIPLPKDTSLNTAKWQKIKRRKHIIMR